MGERGPEPRKLDWDEVGKLVSFQCTQEEVASFFSISVDTLDRACQRDLGMKLAEYWGQKKAVGRIKARKLLWQHAEKIGAPGAVTAAIYLDKKMFPEETPRPPAPIPPEPPKPFQNALAKPDLPLTFVEFCVNAGYPAPFPKQVEMQEFGADDGDVRLLLGSRGYGKTDYVTLLGNAFEIYLDWFEHRRTGAQLQETNLIVTKSKARNTALALEMARVLKANGVPLEKENSQTVRVEGLIGKDDSAEFITIRASMRGRHHKRITMDDPVTEDDVSEAQRRMVKAKYGEALKLKANMILIGQPAHAFDLYSEIRGKVRTLEVPHGTIPELDADLEALVIAGVDQKSISMSYHLKIPKDGASIFANLKSLPKFDPGPGALAFLDPSDGGDTTALTMATAHLNGLAIKGKVWKLAWYHVEELIEVLVANRVRKLFFETNATGNQPIEQLRPLLAPHGIGVVGVFSTTNKHTTIKAAGSMAHLLYLSADSDKAYTDQVVQYEYRSKNDDAPDSLARLMEKLGLLKTETKK